MNINRNPKYKHRGEIAAFLKLADANAAHLAKLIYTLGKLFPKEFYPKRQRELVDAYEDSVGYVTTPDEDIRTHKMSGLTKDAPYIDRVLCGRLLAQLELSAEPVHKVCYTNPDFREALCDNLFLMLHTLHADFGFGQARIEQTAAAWVGCSLSDPNGWLSELIGEDVNRGCDTLALKVLDKRTRRTPQPTVREQLDAARYMEEFRKIMEGFQ